MGICASCDSTTVATAKLILQDGRLQEFSYPVRVSYILAKDPTSFICNSDDMEFDDVLTAVDSSEELQPGQLYFALPLSKLRKPMHAEEMAALAVKANAALMKSARGEKCGCRKKGGKGGGGFFTASAKVADGGANGGGERKVRRGGGRSGNGRRGKVFLANLSAIPE